MFRTIVITATAAAFGSLTGVAAQFAEVMPTPPAWYEHPAVAASLASGIFLIGAKMFEKWWDRKEKKDDADREFAKGHLSLSEKMEELTAQQWIDVIKKRDELHLKEIEFLRQQIITADIARFEYREKHLASMNEVTKLQGAIIDAHKLLDKAGVTYEAVAIRSYYEILDNGEIAKKVADYSAQLNERHANVMQKGTTAIDGQE